MTSDRDDRRKAALKRELDRLRQYAQATRVDHADSARLTDKHVAGLSGVLLSHVGSALREEVGTSLVADEWIAEARTVATWLLRTGAVDVDALEDAGGPKAQGALDQRLTRWSHLLGLKFAGKNRLPSAVPSAGTQAELKLVDSLEARLKSPAYYEVSEEEIKEHSTDLARLLISNWFGVLEDAVEAQPDEAVKLVYRAFPPSASAGAVTQGCETFALPVEQAISLVFDYQKSLATPGHSVELSPLVSLYRSKTGPWYAFHSKRPIVLEALRAQEPQTQSLDEVASWVAQKLLPTGVSRARQSSRSLPLEDIVVLATQTFSPLAIGRAIQLQGSLSMRTAVVRECSVAAAKAVRLRMRDRSSGSTHWASAGSFLACAYAPNLTKNIAGVLLQDLDALSTHNAIRGASLSQLRLAAKFDEAEGVPLLGDVYMLALPTAAALLAEGVDESHYMETVVAEYPAMNNEDPLFSATVEIVTSVVEASESQSDEESKSLGRNLRMMMEAGSEPSAFGLLSS